MDKTKRNKEKTKGKLPTGGKLQSEHKKILFFYIGGTDYGEDYVHNLEKLEEESNDLAALRCENVNMY